MDDY